MGDGVVVYAAVVVVAFVVDVFVHD